MGLLSLIIVKQGKVYIGERGLNPIIPKLWIKGISKQDAEEITNIISQHINKTTKVKSL